MICRDLRSNGIASIPLCTPESGNEVKWDRRDSNPEPKDYESAGGQTISEANQCCTNELRHPDEILGIFAQQKAQHFGPQDDIDAGLSRLIELWPTLSADARQTLVSSVEKLAGHRTIPDR